MSPVEAKKKVEYATTFQHNGKTFHWGEAPFRIKVQLPYLDLFKGMGKEEVTE